MDGPTSGGYPGLRPALLALLACPDCAAGVALAEVRAGDSSAGVREGALRCEGCGREFPVERGVPRMLPDAPDPVRDATVASFGYQWQAFARALDAWRERCRTYLAPFAPDELGRGTVLDAGCGYGRWLKFVAEGGGTCVGLDLSDAVFAAADHLGDAPACHLVQGDILRPPLRRAAFDSVYSIGVLHHLPRGAPEGVAALAPLVAPGGLLFTWLYGAHRGRGAIDVLRHLGARLPRALMRPLCWLAALALWIAFILPKRALHPLAPRLAEWLPFETYRRLPLSELRTDLFDRYATPVEYGYDGDEVRAMLAAAGLQQIEVAALGVPRHPEQSWRGWGRRPAR